MVTALSIVTSAAVAVEKIMYSLFQITGLYSRGNPALPRTREGTFLRETTIVSKNH